MTTVEVQESAVLAVARTLAHAAGRGEVSSVRRLEGGRNNRVYQVEGADGRMSVLKLYHADPRDPRDRLAHEWGFIAYARERGVSEVPEPLACDAARHAALHAHVPGRKLKPGEVGSAHVQQALDFVLRVNAPPRRFDTLPAASEACFSLAEHLAAIERRVARLERLDGGAPHAAAAQALVAQRLRPAWAAAKAEVERGAERLRLPLDESIGGAACLSPSDFGFHNALMEGGRLTFLDFEYAGRDDPAKLACDVFCQPEIPVPMAFYDGFVEGLARGLDLAPADAARCRLLLDAYRVKWACILLNDFLPLGAARRAFAEQRPEPERCAAQLQRAAQSLDLLQVQA